MVYVAGIIFRALDDSGGLREAVQGSGFPGRIRHVQREAESNAYKALVSDVSKNNSEALTASFDAHDDVIGSSNVGIDSTAGKISVTCTWLP